MNAEKFTMTKTIAWLAGGVIAGYLVFWIAPGLFQKRENPLSLEQLSAIAADMNRSVPVMIDRETELTVVEAYDGMLIYKYRLVPYSVSQLDHEKFAASARGRVAQLACNQAETRDNYLKKGVTLRYSYFDKNQQHIATVDVTPADCGF